jgi:hypothetical protein
MEEDHVDDSLDLIQIDRLGSSADDLVQDEFEL